jgi:hypothetical protein
MIGFETLKTPNELGVIQSSAWSFFDVGICSSNGTGVYLQI